MKKTLFSAAVLAASIIALAASKGDKDPVLMKINGKDVKKSEFEYLYHKNNSQQLEPQPIDEYVNLFVNYKLKVAEAEAEGIDKGEAFETEFKQFRNELAAPYLADDSVLDSLINDAYSHYLEDVYVSHIMLPQTGDADADARSRALLDSLRTEIVSGKAKFEDVAMQYSVDRGSKSRGGSMGWVVPGRFPWEFESASYNLKQGEISPVVASSAYGRPIGLHLIRSDIRIPARGEVRVQHILKLTRNVPDSIKPQIRHQIDSIYNVVIAGADFSEVAKMESEDPGSARNGGIIEWFGPGAMVQEFDSVSFALADNEISKPIETAYGYHIVKKLGHRGVQPLDALKENIKKGIENDSRNEIPAQRRMARLKNLYKAQVMPKGLDAARKIIARHGQLDSAALAELKVSKTPIVTVNGKKHSIAEALVGAPTTATLTPESGISYVETAALKLLADLTQEAECDRLYNEVPEYRNLLNEYRDGILLFDISNTKVWDRAAKDTLGLEEYFEKNRANYTFDEPRFKSYIIFCANDSMAELAHKYTDAITAPVDHQKFVNDMREKFGKNVKVERVIAPKGKNAITDYLAFGGEKPAADASRWPVYYAFQGRIISEPEESLDVRGQVTTDYQAYLESIWVDQLRQKYKFSIDKKVRETIK